MKIAQLFMLYWLLFSCQPQPQNRTDDDYAIYNEVLKSQVTTYGVISSHIDFSKSWTSAEIVLHSKNLVDSLIRSQSLQYYLDPQLSILDTLNPMDHYNAGDNVLILEHRPTFSKDSLDFSKIKALTIGKRIDQALAIDDNQPKRLYLGTYDLSEPIYYANDKAVVRLQHHCGNKCGIGYFIYLVKSNKKWKIAKTKEIWIS